MNEFNSTILGEKDQTKYTMSLCDFPIDQKWNLIYRASEDGFESLNFHSKCDDKPNTLIIIKSINGNIFGGYTEQSWCGNGSNKADPNAFIFCLINKHNRPLKMKCHNQNYAIYCSKNYGPKFGYDFYIADKSNKNTTNYSNLGHYYTHPDYAFGSYEAESFLADSFNFQVEGIEVYTKK